MGKLWKSIWLFLLFFLCFSACGKQQPSTAAPALVTCVEAEYRQGDAAVYRIYRTADKMDAVLFYLYGLSPYGIPPENPEDFTLDSCRITVTLSNGQQHIYRQRGDSYFSTDCHMWQKIDPKKGCKLFPLLSGMSSDM